MCTNYLHSRVSQGSRLFVNDNSSLKFTLWKLQEMNRKNIAVSPSVFRRNELSLKCKDGSWEERPSLVRWRSRRGGKGIRIRRGWRREEIGPKYKNLDFLSEQKKRISKKFQKTETFYAIKIISKHLDTY